MIVLMIVAALVILLGGLDFIHLVPGEPATAVH